MTEVEMRERIDGAKRELRAAFEEHWGSGRIAVVRGMFSNIILRSTDFGWVENPETHEVVLDPHKVLCNYFDQLEAEFSQRQVGQEGAVLTPAVVV